MVKVEIGWLLRFFRFLFERRSLFDTLELSPKDDGESEEELLHKENSLGFTFEHSWALFHILDWI